MVCRAAVQTKSPASGPGGAWSLGDNETNESVSGPCGRSMAVAKRGPRPSTVKWAGSREPSFGQRDITRAPLRKLTGAPKASSRNVRHEQRRQSVQLLRRQLVRQIRPLGFHHCPYFIRDVVDMLDLQDVLVQAL